MPSPELVQSTLHTTCSQHAFSAFHKHDGTQPMYLSAVHLSVLPSCNMTLSSPYACHDLVYLGLQKRTRVQTKKLT